MGALSIFELASSQLGGKLVGENLAGGIDPRGTLGCTKKNLPKDDETERIFMANVDNGKSMCATSSRCGVHDPPLDFPSISHVLGQVSNKDKNPLDNVETNKEKIF